MTQYAYRADQELPAMTFTWQDSAGAVIDFSSGWTFTAKVCAVNTPTTVVLTKTTGITGSASAPNVTIDWDGDELAALPANNKGAVYFVYLYARRTSDDKDRVFSPASPPAFRVYTPPA